MDKYNITGMSCAACSSAVERAVSAVDGVEHCSVNLLTNTLSVKGSASEEAITAAVINAGYGVKKNDAPKDTENTENSMVKNMKIRLMSSLFFLVILMYFSMGKMLFGYELHGIFRDNLLNAGLMQMLITIVIMIINKKFFISGFRSLLHRSPNMDVLVSMGSAVAFIYSCSILFTMSAAALSGDTHSLHALYHELYFESAAMILTLITLGKMLEEISKGKTTNAIKQLMDLAPKTAILIRDGQEVVVNVSEIRLGDIFIVKPGSSIPADGEVIEGNSAVDESALTGESMPVDKKAGDKVSQATINKAGFLKCKVTEVGEDTTLSRIIKMVSDATSEKAPISRVADKVSGVFVPVVIGIALITAIIWLLLGESVGYALARGICVLVISCPCALGLATPVAIMVGNGVGAKKGILFKTSEALERTGKVKIIALDKTGTITQGEPRVTDIITAEGISEAELLKIAYTLEIQSEHPIAKAIKEKCAEKEIEHYAVVEFKAIAGSGVKVRSSDDSFAGGNISFIEGEAVLSAEIKALAVKLADEGKTPLLFSKNADFVGIIAVADTVREDSVEAIASFKKLGIRTVMITGDNSKTANAIAKQIGIDDVISDVLPEGKEQAIRKLKDVGVTIMVGDGINDAPALTTADIGIAIGAGTDIAIESADVVLTKSNLSDVVTAVRLSRTTLKNIYENLFWAFSYNIIGIPLAAGAFVATLGWELNPMFGAAAMSFSSFVVVSNALRINLFKEHKNRKDKKIMETVLKIEGMMCPHCEAHVKKALEGVDGVIEAVPSHKKGEAIVKTSKEIPFEELKKVVEGEGYKVL